MSYNIAQLRRNQISSYSTPLTYTVTNIANTKNSIKFYDPSISLSGASAVSALYTYYLRFEVQQMTNSQLDFTIRLQSNEPGANITQDIKTINVKRGNEMVAFELIFHPNNVYNEIVFELERLALDFNIDNGDNTSGRIMQIKVVDFYIINNLIDTYLSTRFQGLKELKKIGIQGPPGLLFTINGEEIRVGRSGIYELYNEDIAISYIGFVVKDSLFTQDGKDYFILDFKY